MRTLAVVVPPPAFDHDLGLRERVEDLAVEQFVPELTSVTPIARTASATGRPCAVSTSTCRSLATISSAVCRFLAILASSSWREAIPQGGPLLRGQATGEHASYVPAWQEGAILSALDAVSRLHQRVLAG